MKVLATLSRDDIRSLEIVSNKVACARQAIHPNAVPHYSPKSAADRFFREAVFAYADAVYMQGYCWRELGRRHGVAEADVSKLHVDFNTNKLFVI
jgi:hypothetical protein